MVTIKVLIDSIGSVRKFPWAWPDKWGLIFACNDFNSYIDIVSHEAPAPWKGTQNSYEVSKHPAGQSRSTTSRGTQYKYSLPYIMMFNHGWMHHRSDDDCVSGLVLGFFTHSVFPVQRWWHEFRRLMLIAVALLLLLSFCLSDVER